MSVVASVCIENCTHHPLPMCHLPLSQHFDVKFCTLNLHVAVRHLPAQMRACGPAASFSEWYVERAVHALKDDVGKRRCVNPEAVAVRRMCDRNALAEQEASGQVRTFDQLVPLYNNRPLNSSAHDAGCPVTGTQLLHSGKAVRRADAAVALNLVAEYLSAAHSEALAPPDHWLALQHTQSPLVLTRAHLTRFTAASRCGTDTVRSCSHTASKKTSHFVQVEVDMPRGPPRLHLAEVQHFLRVRHPLPAAPGGSASEPLRLAVCHIFPAALHDGIFDTEYPPPGRAQPAIRCFQVQDLGAILVTALNSAMAKKSRLFAWAAYNKSHM